VSFTVASLDSQSIAHLISSQSQFFPHLINIMTSSQDPSILTETFHYETSTHVYDIKWGTLGDKGLPPLIFVHGTPWSSRVWNNFAIALSRRFCVYLFDRPGFGESPPEHLKPGLLPSIHPVEQFDSNLARQAEVFAALFQEWEGNWSFPTAHGKYQGSNIEDRTP
jgi:hypothetical protein